MDEVTLSREELQRYSRHLIMPEVGMDGQKKLKASRVLLVGAGGLGSPVALYLAAAGVGTLGIVDYDLVDVTNLHRQILHSTDNVGRSKLESAKEHIRGINPHVDVRTYETRLTSANALDIIREYDVIVDGSDNFPTRYLVNDAAVMLSKPNVYGSIFRFDGQVSVFHPKHGPCYRCLYPSPPPAGLIPNCAESGVLGVLPGIIGSLQALEALKLILGKGEPLIGKLILFDALAFKFREMKLRKNPECPVCSDRPTIRELIDYDLFCGADAESLQEEDGRKFTITPEELQRRLLQGEKIFILDVREPHEYQIANLGGHLIPLQELPKRLNELDVLREIVVHCKMGGRSAKAVELLRQAGFANVKNLRGGIDAWTARIDQKLSRY